MGLGDTFSLESWILWAINTKAKEFLLDIDEKDLASSLLRKGSIHLNNVRVNPRILSNTGTVLPFKIFVAKIDSLKVSIKWLRREVTVEAVGFTVLAESLRQVEWHLHTDAAIASLEAHKKAFLETFTKMVATPKHPRVEFPAFAHLLPTLDVDICDVNLRFEDWNTTPLQPFAWGVRADKITLNSESRYPKWRACFLKHAVSPAAPLLGVNLTVAGIKAYLVPLALEYASSRNLQAVIRDRTPVYPGPALTESELLICVGPGCIVGGDAGSTVRVRWNNGETSVHALMPQRPELRLTSTVWERCGEDADQLAAYVVEEGKRLLGMGLDMFPGIDVVDVGVYISRYQTSQEHAGIHLLPERTPPHPMGRRVQELPPVTIYIRGDGQETNRQGVHNPILKLSPFQVKCWILWGMSFGVFGTWMRGIAEKRWPGAPSTDEMSQYREEWRRKLKSIQQRPDELRVDSNFLVDFEDKWSFEVIIFERLLALQEDERDSIQRVDNSLQGPSTLCGNTLFCSPWASEMRRGAPRIVNFALDIEIRNGNLVLTDCPGEEKVSEANLCLNFSLLEVRVDVDMVNAEPNINIEIGLTDLYGICVSSGDPIVDTTHLFVRINVGGSLLTRVHNPRVHKDHRLRVGIVTDSVLNLTVTDICHIMHTSNMIAYIAVLPDLYYDAATRGSAHIAGALEAAAVADGRHYLPWVSSLRHLDFIVEVPQIVVAVDEVRVGARVSWTPAEVRETAYMRELSLELILWRVGVGMGDARTLLNWSARMSVLQATEDAFLCREHPAIRLAVETAWLVIKLQRPDIKKWMLLLSQVIQYLGLFRLPTVLVAPIADDNPRAVPVYTDIRLAGVHIECVGVIAAVEKISATVYSASSEFSFLFELGGVRVEPTSCNGCYERIIDWGIFSGVDVNQCRAPQPSTSCQVHNISDLLFTPDPAAAVRCGMCCYIFDANGVSDDLPIVGLLATDEATEHEVYAQRVVSLVGGPLWLYAEWGTLLRLAAESSELGMYAASIFPTAEEATQDEEATDVDLFTIIGIQGPYKINGELRINDVRVYLPANDKEGICLAFLAKASFSQNVYRREMVLDFMPTYDVDIELGVIVSNLRIAVGTGAGLARNTDPDVTYLLFPTRFEVQLSRDVPAKCKSAQVGSRFHVLNIQSNNTIEIISSSLVVGINLEIAPSLMGVACALVAQISAFFLCDTVHATSPTAPPSSIITFHTTKNGTELTESIRDLFPAGHWNTSISVANFVVQCMEPTGHFSLVDCALEQGHFTIDVSKCSLSPDQDWYRFDNAVSFDNCSIKYDIAMSATMSIMAYSPHGGKMVPLVEPVLVTATNHAARGFEVHVSVLNVHISLDVTGSIWASARGLARTLDSAYFAARQTRERAEKATVTNLRVGMRVEPLWDDLDGWPLEWENREGSVVLAIKDNMAFVQRGDGEICIPLELLSIGPELPLCTATVVARMWLCHFHHVKHFVSALLKDGNTNIRPKAIGIHADGVLGRYGLLVNSTGLDIRCSDHNPERRRLRSTVKNGDSFEVMLDENAVSHLEVCVSIPVCMESGKIRTVPFVLENFNFATECVRVEEQKLHDVAKTHSCFGTLSHTSIISCIVLQTKMLQASTRHALYLSSHIQLYNRTDVAFVFYSTSIQETLIAEPNASESIPLHWLLPHKDNPYPMVYFGVEGTPREAQGVPLSNREDLYPVVPKRTWKRLLSMRSRDLRDYHQMKGHLKRFVTLQRCVDVCTRVSACSKNILSRTDPLIFVIGIEWAVALSNRLPMALSALAEEAQDPTVLTGSKRVRPITNQSIISVPPGATKELAYITKNLHIRFHDVLPMKTIDPMPVQDLLYAQTIDKVTVFMAPTNWETSPPIMEISCDIDNDVYDAQLSQGMQTFSWPSVTRRFVFYSPYWIINRRDDCGFFININRPIADVQSPLLQLPSNSLRLLHDQSRNIRLGVTNRWEVPSFPTALDDLGEEPPRKDKSVHQAIPHYSLSKSFRIDHANYEQTVIIPRDAQNPVQRCMGYNIEAAPYPFYRTLIVTLVRKYTVVNHKDHPVWVQFLGDTGWQVIAPGHIQPIDPQGNFRDGYDAMAVHMFLTGESGNRSGAAHFDVSRLNHFQVRHALDYNFSFLAKMLSTGAGSSGDVTHCITMVEISHAVDSSASMLVRFLEPVTAEYSLVNTTNTLVEFIPMLDLKSNLKSLAKMAVQVFRRSKEESICLMDQSTFYSPNTPTQKPKMKIVIDNKSQVIDISAIGTHKEKIELARGQTVLSGRRVSLHTPVGSESGSFPRSSLAHYSPHAASFFSFGRQSVKPSIAGEAIKMLKNRIISARTTRSVFHVRTLVNMGVREVHVFHRYTICNLCEFCVLFKKDGEGHLVSPNTSIVWDTGGTTFQVCLTGDAFSQRMSVPLICSSQTKPIDVTHNLAIPLTESKINSNALFTSLEYVVCQLHFLYEPSPGRWEISVLHREAPYIIQNYTDFDLAVCDSGPESAVDATDAAAFWISLPRGRSIPFALFHCDTSLSALRQSRYRGSMTVRIGGKHGVRGAVPLKYVASKAHQWRILFSDMCIRYCLSEQDGAIHVLMEHYTSQFGQKMQPPTRRSIFERTFQKNIHFRHSVHSRSISADWGQITTRDSAPSIDVGTMGSLVAVDPRISEQKTAKKPLIGKLRLDGIGLSLNDNYAPQEVLFFCVTGIGARVSYWTKQASELAATLVEVSLVVGSVQLDIERRGSRVPTLHQEKFRYTGERDDLFLQFDMKLALHDAFASLKTANIRIGNFFVDLDSESIFHVFRWGSVIQAHVDANVMSTLNAQANAIRNLRRDDSFDPLLREVTFAFEKNDYVIQENPLIIEHLYFRRVKITWSAIFSHMNVEEFYTDKQSMLRTLYRMSRNLLLVDVSNAVVNLGTVSGSGVRDLEWHSLFARTAIHLPEMLINDLKKGVLLDCFLTIGTAKIIGNPLQVVRQVRDGFFILAGSRPANTSGHSGTVEKFMRETDHEHHLRPIVRNKNWRAVWHAVRTTAHLPARLLVAMILLLLVIFDSLMGIVSILGNVLTRFSSGGILPDCSQTTARSLHRALWEGTRFGILWNWYHAVQQCYLQGRRLYYAGFTINAQSVARTLALTLVVPRLFIGFFAGMFFFAVKVHQGLVVVGHRFIKLIYPSMREALDPPPRIRDPNTFRSFCLEVHDEVAARAYDVLRKTYAPNMGTARWSYVELPAKQRRSRADSSVFVVVDKVGLFFVQQRKVAWKCTMGQLERAYIKRSDPLAVMFEGRRLAEEGHTLERVRGRLRVRELRLDSEESAHEVFIKVSEFIHYCLKQRLWKRPDVRSRKFAQFVL